MITDAQLRSSQAQSLAGAAATTVSTNAIDLLSAKRNIGRGQQMRLVAIATTAFTGGTSVQVQYIESASAALTSPTVLASGAVIADAAAIAGAVLFDQPPPDNKLQYVGFQYVTVGIHTTGAVSSFIVSDDDFNNYVPAVTGY